MSTSPRTEPLRVVIVGGGVAGIETLIALRSLAGRRVEITLVEPAPEFTVRAEAVGEPFGMASAQRHPIERIAGDFGAELVSDRLESVAGNLRRVSLAGGDGLDYDALVLALGARQRPAWPHAITFGGYRDVAAMQGLVADVGRGDTGSVAFVVPDGVSWPLPLYELALMTGNRVRAGGHEPELVVFTPERRPLEAFGRAVSARMTAELERAGVRLARSAAVDVTPSGDIVLPFEETPMRFERVVALPRLVGPAPRGVTHDVGGFIEIDSHGAVHGMQHVYAAGDGTNYPLKQGGIAAQQADSVAESIAKVAGAGNAPRPFSAVLRAQLFTGDGARFLRGDLSEHATASSEVSDSPLWWPAGKVAGAYLGPYLAAHVEREPVGPVPARRVRTTTWIEESPYGE
jgi:sulfide:quinone oxidoreductase